VLDQNKIQDTSPSRARVAALRSPLHELGMSRGPIPRGIISTLPSPIRALQVTIVTSQDTFDLLEMMDSLCAADTAVRALHLLLVKPKSFKWAGLDSDSLNTKSSEDDGNEHATFLKRAVRRVAKLYISDRVHYVFIAIPMYKQGVS
jgi:hypothetical protein